MELGEKLLLARQEAGLSQRQLCGDVITRNMLSQIEHGTARPSMDTLRYLAGKLGKSVSYFLEDAAPASPNQPVMEKARQAFDTGDYAAALGILAQYRTEDPVYDRERQLLELNCCLALAAEAIDTRREPYARELLTRAEGLEQAGAARYCPELIYRRLALAGRLRDADLRELDRELPSLDEDLYLRGRAAFAAGDSLRAAAFLDAVQKRTPQWNLLRGEIHTVRKEYRKAVRLLQAAEKSFPREAVPILEKCFRELGDFKQAYLYACKQKD